MLQTLWSQNRQDYTVASDGNIVRVERSSNKQRKDFLKRNTKKPITRVNRKVIANVRC